MIYLQDYTPEVLGLISEINNLMSRHINQTGAYPKYVYLGIAERKLLSFIDSRPEVSGPEEVLGLKVIPVSLGTWMKVGIE